MAEIDFDEWLANYKPPEIKFYAVFDPNTGDVKGVYPSHALTDQKNSVEIDQETAQLINEGSLKLNSCFVDISSGKFEIAEIRSLIKIDDVLHRIVDKKWSDVEDPDVVLLHTDGTDELIFDLSLKYRELKRKIHWDGSTELCFFITEYNDPNIVRSIVKFSISELAEKQISVTGLPLTERFSVYTRRLFPKYVIETK
jgi:hypothetical protein